MRVLVVIAIASLALCAASHAAGPYVSGSYQPVQGGYLLQFALHNPLAGEGLYRWFVATSDAMSPSAPEGWEINQDFREVNWHTSDSRYVVWSGQSLGGFSFISQGLPDQLHYSIVGSAGYSGSVTPAPVPEPCSLLALGMGGLGVLGTALRRRVRASA